MRNFILYFIIFISFSASSQERYFSNPVKIPMLLSGSFAELRSNHFHSGIDIKTQGVTGIPVYAVAEGYISRIAVSPGGYGRALYINHPNGTTTVYGHLNSFSKEIEKYVKNQQYKQKSFRVDLEIPAYLFLINKNQEIAKSGNTGSSGGPHLHFEIRDTKSEEPINPLQFEFPVKDNIAPKIFSLLVVPLNDASHVSYQPVQRSFPVVFYDGKYHLKNNPTIPVYGKIGFAIQANDYFDGTYNKCGINQLALNVDGENTFSFQLNRFAFHNSRYINSHIVYDEYISSHRRFIKAWIEPGNSLPIYNYNFSGGILNTGNQKHLIDIEIRDTYGNSSSLTFNVEGKIKKINAAKSSEKRQMLYNSDNEFSTDEVQLKIHEGALYNNIKFAYKKQPTTDAFYSDFHVIHNNTVPLQKPVQVKIKPRNLPDSLHSKVVLVYADDKSDRLYANGGRYEDGWVSSEVKMFGTYALVVDTIAPIIKPLSIANNKLTESNRIRFKITDDLSGIKTIEGLIDGKWALFEYDAKSSRITHYFDAERFELQKRHEFILTITDYRGNSAEYSSSFWK